jgi:hypothetical protein
MGWLIFHDDRSDEQNRRSMTGDYETLDMTGMLIGSKKREVPKRSRWTRIVTWLTAYCGR